mgnify:CR=1 FL=1
MCHSRLVFSFVAVLAVSATLACSRSTPLDAPSSPAAAPAAPASPAEARTAPAGPAEAPAAPTMPAHWTVVSDESFAAVDIQPVAASLGGKISALRNTTYDVGGKPIKLNTIVAATATDADTIMAALGQMKPEEWFVRNGLVIYEFVGANDVQSEMRDARTLLMED